MRIVLLGAPASGKGTQAALLEQRLGIPKISTGDMLRAARKAGTQLGQEAERYMNAGQLVPDSVVIGLVIERLKDSDAQKGFILDGFPRTVAQADALEQALVGVGTALDFVLQIDVPRGLLLERATGRRSDVRTGQIYHLKYNPPPPGVDVEQRADDQEETVSRGWMPMRRSPRHFCRTTPKRSAPPSRRNWDPRASNTVYRSGAELTRQPESQAPTTTASPH